MRVPVIAATAFTFALSCLFVPSFAKADSFSFNISGDNVVGSGVLTAQTTAVSGQFLVTGATGTINGVQIVNSLPGDGTIQTVTFPDTFFINYDNLVTPTAAVPVDGAGLAFQLADGVDYDFGNDPVLGSVYVADDGMINFDQQTFTPPPDTITLGAVTAVTPEPSSFLLLGTGLLGAAGMLRRRFGSV